MGAKFPGLRGWWMVLLLPIASLAASSDLRLVEAVQKQDKAAIRSLLKQHTDVNARQADGATALAWAVHWDDLETADVLIRAGANVNAANDYGVTPLSLACTNGSAAMVEKLLQAGADPNVALPTGEMPLLTAAAAGSVDTVKLLLARGVDVNARETRGGQTALMWAVAEKHPEVARVLIEHGADVHARSKGGFTPLLFAAQQGDLDSVQILLAAGADVNEATSPLPNNPRTAYLPSGVNNADSLPLASASPSNDDARSTPPPAESPWTGRSGEKPGGGMTPLLVATASGHEALAIFLLDKGADPNAADLHGTALNYAVRKGIAYLNRQKGNVPNMVELVKHLLANGANPNAAIRKNPAALGESQFAPILSIVGATPFLLATASADLSLMRLLLANGADPLLATKEKTTPLMVAAGVGRTDDRTEEEGKSALEAVKLLVELGADVNAVNEEDGQTALHGAARVGADPIIRFLVDRGAKMDVMDKMGQTPLSIAMGVATTGIVDFTKKPFGVHPTTVDLLLKLGATPLAASGVDVLDPVKEGARPQSGTTGGGK